MHASEHSCLTHLSSRGTTCREAFARVVTGLSLSLLLVAKGQGQTPVLQNVILNGTPVLNPGSTLTQIYLLFPPQAKEPNHTRVLQYVMPQTVIDGVNLELDWNSVETTAPTQTDCTVLPAPASNPDRCQPDPFAQGWFHTYDWTTVDGTGCMDVSFGSISQWFCDFPWGSGNFKKVVIQLFGIGPTPTNGVTPAYVTTNYGSGTSWPDAVGAVQDAVNTVNAYSGLAACSGYSGDHGSTGNNTPITGNNDGTATVSWNSATSPIQAGDRVWLRPGFSGHGEFDVTAANGASVTDANSTTFTYTIGTNTRFSGNTGGQLPVTTAAESWPIPLSTPYQAAFRSFLRAAIYHFNHLNITSTPTCHTTPDCQIRETTSQIAYIRPGIARGGEAIPICSSQTHTPMTDAGFSKSTWENWYQSVADTAVAASPLMPIMMSINASDPQAPDITFANDEAALVVSRFNGRGQAFGFGSQGLAISDMTNFSVGDCPGTSGAGDTGNNWGCMFFKYWNGATSTLYPPGAVPTMAPLELQQIDCSNPCPTGSTCINGQGGGSGDTCFQGGAPGKTQDLRTLFPWVANQFASIVELYAQDALLAFDPNYCTLPSPPIVPTSVCRRMSSDEFFAGLSSATQLSFFQYVGLGKGASGTGSCYTQYNNSYITITPEAYSTGDCSYAAALYALHGFHVPSH